MMIGADPLRHREHPRMLAGAVIVDLPRLLIGADHRMQGLRLARPMRAAFIGIFAKASFREHAARRCDMARLAIMR